MFAFKSNCRALLPLIAFSLMGLAAAAADAKQGIITEIAGSKITVLMRTEQMSFVVSSGAVVSLNGQPAQMTDLRVGDAATITFVKQDDVSPTVQRLDAMRLSTPGNPDPVR